jgi:hypothetical protein
VLWQDDKDQPSMTSLHTSRSSGAVLLLRIALLFYLPLMVMLAIPFWMIMATVIGPRPALFSVARLLRPLIGLPKLQPETDAPAPEAPVQSIGYLCPLCDDTGYQDYAGFCMDLCPCIENAEVAEARLERAMQ